MRIFGGWFSKNSSSAVVNVAPIETPDEKSDVLPASEVLINCDDHASLKDNFGRLARSITTQSGSEYLLLNESDATITQLYLVPRMIVGFSERAKIKGNVYNKGGDLKDGNYVTTTPVRIMTMEDGTKVSITGVEYPRVGLARIKGVTCN